MLAANTSNTSVWVTPSVNIAAPAITVTMAALTVLPLALILHGPPKLDLSPIGWSAVIGQGIFSTFLATAAYQFGLARVGSASAGVFINIEPLMGAILGVSLFGDKLTLPLAGGGLLIIAGSLLVVLGERDAPVAEMETAPPMG